MDIHCEKFLELFLKSFKGLEHPKLRKANDGVVPGTGELIQEKICVWELIAATSSGNTLCPHFWIDLQPGHDLSELIHVFSIDQQWISRPILVQIGNDLSSTPF